MSGVVGRYSKTDLYTDVIGPRGAAMSLLFMHGPGLDHTYFRPSVEALAGEHQLVFYDARLCGRSPRASSRAADLDVLADDLEEVASTVATAPVVAVAHSFAPLVALHSTRRVGTQLRGLILVAPGIAPSIGQTLFTYVQTSGSEAQRHAIERAFTGGITSDRELEEAWETILPLYVSQYNDRIANEVLGGVRFSALAFNSFVEHAAGRLDWQSAVGQLRMPLLVIAGADDWVERDPSGGSRAIAAASSNGTLRTLSDCGHFPFAEQPDAFVTVVHSWLMEHQDEITTTR